MSHMYVQTGLGFARLHEHAYTKGRPYMYGTHNVQANMIKAIYQHYV